MTSDSEFEIFLVATPGLEAALCAEVREHGWPSARQIKGGVTFHGGWPDVWRANLVIRGAGRVLARIGQFRAMHLAQLDKRARRIAWGEVLRADRPFRVEASCTKSRIYHSGAAAERITRAIREELGAKPSDDAAVVVKARIDDDLCTLAIDTSGEPLHKRGHKEEVAKAPMRETMAAMLLRLCDYDGREPVVDPMCGSGTFVIEAAEIAAGLLPGRTRHFAFEMLATFDSGAWQTLRGDSHAVAPAVQFHGSDHDAGAIRMSIANAGRAGVATWISFQQVPVVDLMAPVGSPGLVIVNPPYGERIGDGPNLPALYRTFGETMRSRFPGWRIGLITSEPALAVATGLKFLPASAPILHGGKRVYLFRT